MTIEVMNAWSILYKGGAMMWPILLLSIIAMAVGIHRLRELSMVERRLSAHKNVLMESLRQAQLKDCLRLCEEHRGPLAALLKAGLLKFGSSRALIRGAMEEVMEYESHVLKKNMDILTMIVNLAPLLGLLGTVNAMTIVFHAVQIRANVMNPLTAGELASGIWQSLLCTSAGLGVGILSYVLYGFCAFRINAILAFLNRSMAEVTNVLNQIAELRGQPQVEAYDA